MTSWNISRRRASTRTWTCSETLPTITMSLRESRTTAGHLCLECLKVVRRTPAPCCQRGDHDSFRIRNVLAYVFLARGTPIIYYGTEQSLTGHQANVLEMLGFSYRDMIQTCNNGLQLRRVALEKDGRMNKGQAYVRESMWQTRRPGLGKIYKVDMEVKKLQVLSRYNTSTWQYEYIKQL